MADPLHRYEEDFPDVPNMNVVPPAAPLGSADPATTAGSTFRDDFILHDDEVDLANRPRHLLEPYNEAREREWPVGGFSNVFQNAGNRLRLIARNVRRNSADGSLNDYAEEWKDRAADLVDDIKHSASQWAGELQSNASEWQGRASEWSKEVRDRGVDRIRQVRTRTGEFIDERPAHAIAIAAGIGFTLGVLLRVGRSRRDY